MKKPTATTPWGQIKAFGTFLALTALLLLTAPAHAKTLHGTVIKVSDGDTLTLLSGKRQYKIRLTQIDAPEKEQAYGQRARRSLSELSFRQEARVETDVQDKYGRTVGTVWVADRNINMEQVRRGMAWVYTQYSHSRDMLQIEQEARLARRGLWAENKPIPPWEWRHAHPSSSHGNWGWLSWLKSWQYAQTTQQPAPITDRANLVPQCGIPKTCKEMANCEEARFYLERCGLKRLDNNGDGIPCESLCR